MRQIKLYFFLILMSLVSCIDKIDLLTSETAKSVVVIDGKIAKYKNEGSVTLSIFQSSFDTDRPFGLSVDEASVIDSKGNKLTLNREKPGLYSAKETSTFKFTFGEKYKIKVVNGKDIYESEVSELSSSPAIDSISYKWLTTPSLSQGKIDLYIKAKIDPNLKNKTLHWTVTRTYKVTEQLEGGPSGRVCYPTFNDENLYNENLFDLNKFNSTGNVEINVATRPVNYQFGEGTYFTVVLSAVDKKTEKYYQVFNNLINRDGGIFETPPGPIPTNFKCISDSSKIVTGYFYAEQQDTARIFIDPLAIGTPKRTCPQPPNEAGPCPFFECCDCRTLPKSTVVKPSFWK